MAKHWNGFLSHCIYLDEFKELFTRDQELVEDNNIEEIVDV